MAKHLFDASPGDLPIFDARALAAGAPVAEEMETRGFCLVGGVQTTLSRAELEEHFLSRQAKGVASTITFDGAAAVPGVAGPFTFAPDASGRIERLAGDADAEYIARNQHDLAAAVRRAFPGAELLLGYNQVVRSSEAPDPNAAGSAVRAADSSAAEDAAASILARLQFVNQYPAQFKDQLKACIDDDSALVESVLSWYLGADKKMLDPGGLELLPIIEEQWAQVQAALLRSGLAPVKEALISGRAQNFKAADDGKLDPPAVGGAHTDMTDRSAMARLPTQVAALEAAGLHAFRRDRYVCYHLNTWRNIDAESALEDYHLAVLDKSSVEEGDLAISTISFEGYEIEQFRVSPRPHHRWGVFDRMTRDELLCFTQGRCFMQRAAPVAVGTSRGDSAWQFELPELDAGDGLHGSSSVSHMAVRDPRAAQGKHRSSCETRFLVFVPADADVRSPTSCL
jgi:hypothetical protein